MLAYFRLTLGMEMAVRALWLPKVGGACRIKEQRPRYSDAVAIIDCSFYFVGVNLMIPIEFSGRVRVNCFLMVP